LWGIPAEEVAVADAHSLIERLSTLLVNPSNFRTEIGNCLNPSEDVEQTVWELTDGRFCEFCCQPQLIDGQRVGSVWSFRDITVRKKALDELSKNEAFLRAILESLNDSIVACDANGNLTRFDHVASGIDPSADVPSPEDWAERSSAIRDFLGSPPGGPPNFTFCYPIMRLAFLLPISNRGK
jgi:PAS domain-containing protein